MDKEQYYQINTVIDFIKKNIDRKINLEELSSLTGFSQYHFHRIFSLHVGETIGSFIRRIKLENAAFKLKYDNSNIIEIAYEAGYETPAAFTRAFKQHYGIPPSEYKQGNNMKYFIERKPEYYIYLKELMMKNFIGIKELDDLNVISVRKTGKYSDSACEAWSVLCKFAYMNTVGKQDKLITPESKFIGRSFDDPKITPEEKLRYEACITVKKDVETEGEVFKSIISGGKYAVFLHKGSYENLKDTYEAIFMEWLPNSDNTLRDVPCFEIYLNRDPRRTKPENLKTEIYLPIK